MKGVIFVTRKQIDAARETRLCISQIVIPAATACIAIMTIPEVRQTIAAKAISIKQNIESKIHKKD